MCFDNKRVKSPTEVVCMICSFLIHWAGLLKGGLRQQVIQGAEAVKTVALFFHREDLKLHTQEERQLIPYAGYEVF